MFTLIVSKSPLDLSGAASLRLKSGVSIEQVIQGQTGKYQPGEHQPVLVLINGALVEPKFWPAVELAANDSMVVVPRVAEPMTIFYIVLVVASSYYSYRMASNVPNLDRIDAPEASPSAEFNPDGNRARLGSVIPARYGRWRVFPDFASAPVREFSGINEYVSFIFAIGHGQYDATDLRIGDTALENFEDYESHFYLPGEPVSLVPTAVFNSPEVSGGGIILHAPNEDSYTGPVGAFVATPAGVQTIQLEVDIALPRGLNNQADDGSLETRTARVKFEYREIDEFGQPVGLGSWTLMVDHTVRNATFDPLRFTLKKQVPAGRYEMRAVRLNVSSDSYRENDEIRWVGLRSILDDDQIFPCFTWAVRIRVTNQLSALAERKFNGIFTRKLPVWDVANGWSLPVATRNPIWAFCDVLKAQYGGKYGDGNFEDLDSLAVEAAVYDSRGDYFDGQFDTQTTVWRALRQVLFVGRAYPLQFGDVFSVVRDGPQNRGHYMFNGRNTQKDSLTIAYKTVDEWGDDSVEVEYVDPVTWKSERILCIVPGSAGQNPTRIKLFGCTDAKQAYREGMFNAAKQVYRNINIDFTTELDGAVPRYLDRLQVVAHLPRWGVGGEVVGIEQSPAALRLSEPVDDVAGASVQVWLRRDTGASEGPFAAAVDADPSRLLFIDAIPAFVNVGFMRERTYFAVSTEHAKARTFIADSFSPTAEGIYKVGGVLDAPEVHQFDELVDNGTLPVPGVTPPVAPESAVVDGVYVIQGGTVENPRLRILWNPVKGSTRYIVEVRYSPLEEWRRVYFGELSFCDIEVAQGIVYIRVAALVDVLGAWTYLQVDAGNEFDQPPIVSGLNLSAPFTGLEVQVEWVADLTAASWFVELANVDGVVKWQQAVSEPAFTFDAESAGRVGLNREFDVRVFAVNAYNVRSLQPSVIRVKNDQVPYATGFFSIISLKTAHIAWDLPLVSDYAGAILWVSSAPNQPLAQAQRYEQLDPLKSGFTIPIDVYQTYYFRLALFDVWGKDELNTTVEFSDIASGIRNSDLAQDLQTEVARIDVNANSIQQEIFDRAGAVNVVASDLASEVINRAAADDLLQSSVDGNAAAIVSEQTIRSNEDLSLASNISGLAAVVDGNSAAMLVEQTARADADTALSSQITTLSSGVADANSAIVAEQTTRSAADDALSADILSLFSGVGDNQSAILNEQTARANADSALSTDITGLTSSVGDNAAAILVEQSARASGDAALSDLVSALTADVNSNAAALVTEQSARADADSAQALEITTLQGSVGDNTGSIQAQNSVIATIDGDVSSIKLEQYIKLDNNGFVTGSGQWNNGPGASGFVVHADMIGFGHPTAAGIVYPFIVQNGQVYISSAYITDLDVGRITGDVGNFVVSNIANGAIDNAKIGNEISSSNFLSGSQGWKVNKDGTAEFHNGVFRGTLEASSLKANTAMVQTSHLGDASVNTLKIAGNSVIIKESAFSDVDFGVASSGVDGVSKSITLQNLAPGSTLLVTAVVDIKTGYQIDSTSSSAFAQTLLTILRNGIQILQTPITEAFGAGDPKDLNNRCMKRGLSHTVIWPDSPGVGTHTYTLRFSTLSNSSNISIYSNVVYTNAVYLELALR